MTAISQPLDERTKREHQEATMRSIEATKNNIKMAIQEAKQDTPRFAQTMIDFQNETADATTEIAETFLESQKDVVISIQSVWIDVADRTGRMPNWNYWWLPAGGMVSPIAMATMYTRLIDFMSMNFAAGTRIAMQMMFAGIEAAKATTRYARDNSRQMSRVISINAKAISHVTRETVVVQGSAANVTAAVSPETTENMASGSNEEVTGSAKRK